MINAWQIIPKKATPTVAQWFEPVSVAAEEGQVVDDGDIYEMLGLLDDPGNRFKIIATLFGDENIWRALWSEEEGGQRQLGGVGVGWCEDAQPADCLLLSHMKDGQGIV